MDGVIDLESDCSEFVEIDPTGRYGRYNEILGKGASKIVYRAFDEYEGIEVAWNQVKLYDFLQSPEDLERLYCEIHLLKTLKHDNIMKFYTSWVDTANRNINFVTEMFTSGTLRQYRLKHKKINIRAIKHWCRQILQGLLYLHSHDPPVIHRDLKCDNIFINGNQGEVKIGDLGLAAILRKSHAARCVGTPEFMAPEVYKEEYNELVDIYSFGMCILEMVTFEYPYSECNHPAQIYNKVISGKKPEALYKVKDPEVRRFVEKCLATVSDRLSAWELLNDPFLEINDYLYDLRPLNHDEIRPVSRQPLLFSALHSNNSYLLNDYYEQEQEQERDLDCNSVEYEATEFDLFTSHDGDDHLDNVDITIKGKRNEDDNIFLRLRIADKEGHVRNIYFPFDIEVDTAISVATEMVAELDIMDQDVTKIADMIDGEIESLVPEWNKGDGEDIEESPVHKNDSFCQNCASDGSSEEPLPSHKLPECSKHVCGSIHGRFEEITYEIEGSEKLAIEEEAHVVSNQPDGLHYTDIWVQHMGQEASSIAIKHTTEDDESILQDLTSLKVDYQNEIKHELRWLKAKFQMQLRELGDQHHDHEGDKDKANGKHLMTKFSSLNIEKNGNRQKVYDYESAYGLCNPQHLATGKSFYTGPIHRATSLPVDATEF